VDSPAITDFRRFLALGTHRTPARNPPGLVRFLTFRGIAFEFRLKAQRWRRRWSRACVGGSPVAAFAQGFALGRYTLGFAVEGGRYVGTNCDWLYPFGVPHALTLQDTAAARQSRAFLVIGTLLRPPVTLCCVAWWDWVSRGEERVNLG